MRSHLSELRRAMDDSALVAGPSGYGRIVHDPWRSSDVLRRHLLTGPLPRIASEALGTTAVLFQDHLVSKTPGTTEPVKWHQDYSYWPLADAVGVTMWVALDDSTLDNGCLHYLPGSHRGGERRPADFIEGADRGGDTALPPIQVHPNAVVSMPIAAGGLLLHDPLVLHMSCGNRTQSPRRAWSITWVTEQARWAPEHAPHPYNWSMGPTPGGHLDPTRFPRVVSG